MKTHADLIEALAAYRVARDAYHELVETDGPSMVKTTALTQYQKAAARLAEVCDDLDLQDKLCPKDSSEPLRYPKGVL